MDKKQKADEDQFNNLHQLITKALIDHLNNGGEISPAMVGKAIDWCKVNDITGVATDDNPLGQLARILPTIDIEQVRRTVNGSKAYN